jgi:hypothetical protein
MEALVKANVCTLLEPILTSYGFPILNRGRSIPFPSTGQQGKFREAVRQVLELGVAPTAVNLRNPPSGQ